jgi:4-amino-4-deoxy-L-arabinose transferase-like glycosyltransferase
MKREHVVLIAVCMAALVLRVAYVLTLEPRIYWFDGEQYSHLATQLVQHGVYSRYPGRPSAYWPPGYPFFLAGIYALFGVNLAALRVAQGVLGALTVALTCRVARRVLDPGGAMLAAAVAAAYPFFVYSAGAVFPVVLQGFLLLASVHLALRTIERGSRVAAIGSGVLAGCASLTIGSALPGALLVAPWIAWAPEWRSRPRHGVWMAALYLLGVLGPVGVWALRNQQAFGRPVIISTNFGYNLWLGNYPGVKPTTGSRYDVPGMEEESRRIWESRGTEASRDAQFLRLGLAHIASDVPTFLRLSLGKAVEFWAVYSEPMTQDRPRVSFERLAGLLSYGLLLPFALVWLLVSLRGSRVAWLVFLLLALNTAIHAVILSKLRYRLPLDTFLIIYGVGGVLAFGRWARARLRPVAPGSTP